jgi:hypothetical protein
MDKYLPRRSRGAETARIGPVLFGCICRAVVVHIHGVPCAAILVLLYIWKDLSTCLALESFCAGCAGLPSARHQRSGMTCLVRVYLLCCCGACLRRSLRCHTGAFIHLERFEGLSCARKNLAQVAQVRPRLDIKGTTLLSMAW